MPISLTWNHRYALELVSALLLLLFLYTALSKLLDYEIFQGELEAQYLPDPLTTLLAWALPAVELLASGLLFFNRTRRYGLWLSTALMAVVHRLCGAGAAGSVRSGALQLRGRAEEHGLEDAPGV